MTEPTSGAWGLWQQQISVYLHEHGLLPTLTTEGIDIPFNVAADCWMMADTRPSELPSLCRLTDAMGTPAERGAVILFLAHLSDDEPYLRLPEPEESERRAAVQKIFADAVALLPVDQVETPWHVRWELPFAAKIGLWDRIDALVRRWVALAPSEERDALTTLARINFLSVHPARPSDWVSDWWSPYEGSQHAQVGDLFASLLAARLDDRTRLDSAQWSFPRTMPADQFARVLDADTAIAKLHDTGKAPSPTLRLIWAWCSAVAGVRLENVERTRDAARRYALLARDSDLPTLLFGSVDHKMRRFPASSAAMLFRAAGDLDSARDMAVFWTEVDQASPDAWKFRAELERQIGIEAWAESYERYVRLSPDTDTSWEHSELLRLLLESRDRNTADRALRALAFEHADRPVVEEMLTWDWAAYSQLNESARERWWDGLVFVCDARVRNAFRRAPWRYAAACFGEAVALELRARVFGPLAMTAGFERQAMSDREARIANAILGSKATLGTMIEALDLTNNANSDLGRMIDRFLGQRHGLLKAHFRSKQAVARLKALTDSRNEAVHGDIAPEEAKHVYAEARAFLDMLVKADPRILDR
ncbi:MAG: hypothetical protein WBD07_03230 [Vicinamibacterales bacterium]